SKLPAFLGSLGRPISWLFILLVIGMEPAQSLETKHPIYGSWQWSHLLYNGQELPRPNPKLRIQFDFNAGGTSRLYWEREGQTGFCERLAQFSIQGDTLVEMITWVNPNNAAECARDPDMQAGRMSRTPFTFDAQGRLMIRVYVADWDVWYVWERLNPVGTN
ncbi:MAG: hypothetical protein N2Z70_07720, partial [Bdellovibrionaceae bacterium]|nr:hypothetical protein [Pseudobdellovibrionaceae bacterium]